MAILPVQKNISFNLNVKREKIKVLKKEPSRNIISQVKTHNVMIDEAGVLDQNIYSDPKSEEKAIEPIIEPIENSFSNERK